MYYVVCVETVFDSLDDVSAQAPQDLAAHVARSKALHASGSVLMAGAFVRDADEPLCTMAICPSREAAQEYIRGDPFVQQGLVRRWRIREWRDLFARPDPADPLGVLSATHAAMPPAGEAGSEPA